MRDSSSTRSRWTLHSTRSVFVIADSANADQQEVRFLAISRDTGTAREAVESPAGFKQKLEALATSGGGGAGIRTQVCNAVLGCVVADQAAFLLVVTEASVAVKFDGQVVHEIQRCEALPFVIDGAEAPGVAGVRQLLERNFYFSDDFDVTRRLQSRQAWAAANGGAPTTENMMLAADDRFVWNRRLVEPLMCQEGVSARWFTPVMQGFFKAKTPKVNVVGSQPLLLVLIARRSCRHAGTRYNARGLDDDGEAANWIETEQVALTPKGDWFSLAQVRGSAPVFWEQLSGKAAVSLTRGPELISSGFEKHRRVVEAEYGQVVFVNLLSGSTLKQATEGVLIDALIEQKSNHDDVQLVTIDFHARVGNWHQNDDINSFDGRLEAVAREAVGDVFHRLGHFEAQGTPHGTFVVKHEQVGVIRTNCFDCLDRTNMLQSELAYQWLSRICREHGGDLAALVPCALKVTLPRNLPLQAATRKMWVKLGDVLSELYTGAASTMGATLRQGGTNAISILEMGWNTMNRAIHARFGDDVRQEAYRLALGPQRLFRAPRPPEVRRAPCGTLTVATITWNMQGRPCWSIPGALTTMLNGACSPLGPNDRPVDVVVLCCQEIVKLSAANVVTLSEGDPEVQDDLDQSMLSALDAAQGEAFIMVTSIGMVGLYLGVFVAERLKSQIGGVASNRLRCGAFGQGNKGALVVRLDVAATSLAALSVHLESGGGKSAERASQLEEALGTSFHGSKTVQSLKLHDLLIIGGDFNFRLAVPQGSEMTDTSTLDGEWPNAQADGGIGRVGEGAAVPRGDRPESGKLFDQYDEVFGSKACRGANEVFQTNGLVEGHVLFPPTYKLLQDNPGYDASRMPAWTDRIFHSKVGTSRRRYCALGGLMLSDHRPVCALLETNHLAYPNRSASADFQDRTLSGTASSTASPTASPASNTPASSSGAPSMATVAEPLVATGNVAAVAPVPAVVAPQVSTPGASNNATVCLDDLLGDPPGAAAISSAAAVPLASISAPSRVRTCPPSFSSCETSRAADAASAAAAVGLTIGQSVVAQFRGGWYLATVTRVRGSLCDIAWLRPRGQEWGSQEKMRQYMCSTGEDETLHGDGLPIATHIRLPDGSLVTPLASGASVAAPLASPASISRVASAAPAVAHAPQSVGGGYGGGAADGSGGRGGGNGGGMNLEDLLGDGHMDLLG